VAVGGAQASAEPMASPIAAPRLRQQHGCWRGPALPCSVLQRGLWLEKADKGWKKGSAVIPFL